MTSIKLSNDNYFDIEQIIRKIAKEHNIKNISKVNINLFKDNGFMKFAIVDPWEDIPEDFGEKGGEYSIGDGPYIYNITYDIVTPESAEIGDYEDSGFEIQDAEADDMDDLIHQLEDYGFAEDNRPGSLDELTFSTVDAVHDRAYFEDGESKYYTVFIKREDGKDFEPDEAGKIRSRLGIR